MNIGPAPLIGASLLYVALLFLVALYAHIRHREGRSIVSNSFIYSLSIAVYCTSWTFYGSVGKAATTGLDFLLIYLGPSLTAFTWWFLLRKLIRISKDNNITSIADFISSRYGKSQFLGGLITIIAILGIIPYIALQLKAISTTFVILSSDPALPQHLSAQGNHTAAITGFVAATVLSVFGVMFGARSLTSAERHEGLVAAIAFESIVKLITFLAVGIYVTYFMFDGFSDIFARMSHSYPTLFDHLTTIGENDETSYANWATMLFISMGSIMLLPRQFHIMVIENSDEKHVKQAMWRFPAYLFVMNIFVIPIAFAGILTNGTNLGADYFVLTLPMNSGHFWLALLAFLGGISAASGMVMAESVAVSTMLLNHLVMPLIVRLKPRDWFPLLLINLKRLSIFLVVFLGYAYYLIIRDTYTLVNIGLISFAAAAQFAPTLIGSLYWRRGNKSGAIAGILGGFVVWFYTLLLPSFVKSGWWQSDILENGPFGLALLKPTELFGLTGLDIWSNSIFWSMLFNLGGYLLFSILISHDEVEKEQIPRFVDVYAPEDLATAWETKRLSKPVTIMEFVNLMAKFIGEAQAHAAITEYLGDREIDAMGMVSEFELPNLKRFVEKTLAGSLGSAAAGAIVVTYLSDVGSQMESFYDVFRSVRSSLEESREALYVRLKSSEILNRSQDMNIIIRELLELLESELKFDLIVVRLFDGNGNLKVRSVRGSFAPEMHPVDLNPVDDHFINEMIISRRAQFANDTRNLPEYESLSATPMKQFTSFAHIPIMAEGEPVGVLSVFSSFIIGLFTEPLLNLLSSLAGQLALAVQLVGEREAKEQERKEKVTALMKNASVAREMELAKQIQLSLLPEHPPVLPGATFASLCVPASDVGGDYYDFFPRENGIVDAVIADVSGHNVGAALIMVATRSVLRTQVNMTGSTGEILSRLNDLLLHDLSRAELFITMFYIKYDTASRTLHYSSAGHNKPILYRHSTGLCHELDAEGLILGVKPGVLFEENTLVLDPGDILLLYTDGLTESSGIDGEMFGVDRLMGMIVKYRDEQVQSIVDNVFSEMMNFATAPELSDDVSIVAMKVDEPILD